MAKKILQVETTDANNNVFTLRTDGNFVELKNQHGIDKCLSSIYLRGPANGTAAQRKVIKDIAQAAKNAPMLALKLSRFGFTFWSSK